MSSQYIHLQIGGFGTGVGTACWELYLADSHLESNGKMISRNGPAVANSFFREIEQGTYKPRVILFDSDSIEHNKIKTGKYGSLFSGQYVSNKRIEDCKVYDDIFEQFQENDHYWSDALRVEVERCDRLAGFIMLNSSKGITGSGLATHLLALLHSSYKPASKIAITEVSSSNLDGMRTYLSAIYQSKAAVLTDCNFCVNMDSVGRVCKNSLEHTPPSMENCNRLIAQAISNITMFDRLTQSGGASRLHNMYSNLQLSRRIHFPTFIFSSENIDRSTTWELTKGLFVAENCLCEFNPMNGSYIGCSVNYRGIDSKKAVCSDLRRLKSLHPYHDVICSTLMSVDNLPSPPVNVSGDNDAMPMSRSVTMACHTTGIKSFWKQLAKRIDVLYQRHLFFQNFEPDFFAVVPELTENVLQLAAAYQEFENNCPDPNDNTLVPED